MLAQAAVEGGADLVELGFPFSDPLADGPVIRRAAERALAQGMRTGACLEVLAATRERLPETPLVPMTYSSLLEAHGWERFAADAQAAGATSMIVADLPAGERPELRRVQLVAPTSTDERLALAAAQSDGWLYLVTRHRHDRRAERALPRARRPRRARESRDRAAALRRLRHLDPGARACSGRAGGRDRRRLARRRGRRGRPAGSARLRLVAAGSTRRMSRLRSAAAGAVAATVWGLAEPLDQRLLRCDYSDIAVLGKAVTRGPGWRSAGFVLHAANGAVFGLAFEELRRRVPVPPRRLAVAMALAEHTALYPLCAVIDRYHPARGEPGIPPLLTNPRAFAQATWRHLLFGTVLGRLAA